MFNVKEYVQEKVIGAFAPKYLLVALRKFGDWFGTSLTTWGLVSPEQAKLLLHGLDPVWVGLSTMVISTLLSFLNAKNTITKEKAINATLSIVPVSPADASELMTKIKKG